jgi:hemerythrin-like metal-binding protein
MKWNNSFAIGISTIDAQHRRIFEHLLAIENAVTKRDPWHIQRFLLDELASYMKFHLAVEESLLEVVHYPGRAGHEEAHAGILAQVAELEQALKHSESQDKLVGFFENWFVNHVLEGDRAYATYISEAFPELAGER